MILCPCETVCIEPHIFKHTAVDIGFLMPLFFTMENGSATSMVCAEIDRGSLERQVVAYLSTILGGTATRKQKHELSTVNFKHNKLLHRCKIN
jgi:hypothetical protein